MKKKLPIFLQQWKRSLLFFWPGENAKNFWLLCLNALFSVLKLPLFWISLSIFLLSMGSLMGIALLFLRYYAFSWHSLGVLDNVFRFFVLTLSIWFLSFLLALIRPSVLNKNWRYVCSLLPHFYFIISIGLMVAFISLTTTIVHMYLLAVYYFYWGLLQSLLYIMISMYGSFLLYFFYDAPARLHAFITSSIKAGKLLFFSLPLWIVITIVLNLLIRLNYVIFMPITFMIIASIASVVYTLCVHQDYWLFFKNSKRD